LNTPDSTNGNAPQTASGQQAAQRAKKPYQKPAFRFERVFETMALTCGKVNTTQPQCHFNRKLS
jgi:hypothetical protein